MCVRVYDIINIEWGHKYGAINWSDFSSLNADPDLRTGCKTVPLGRQIVAIKQSVWSNNGTCSITVLYP